MSPRPTSGSLWALVTPVVSGFLPTSPCLIFVATPRGRHSCDALCTDKRGWGGAQRGRVIAPGHQLVNAELGFLGLHKQPSSVCSCLERMLTPSLIPESSTHHLFHSKPSLRLNSLASPSRKASLTTPASPRHLCYPLSLAHTPGLPVWMTFSMLHWGGRRSSSSVTGACLSNVELTIL